MSSFTPRSWKSQAEPQADRPADAPAGKFHAYKHGKPNNLPIASTSFIGRDRDVAEVKELLERHRLVTLLGSGGVGKTRLAMQVGAELLDRFPDGVWFADLAPISDLELVSSVIAQALGMAQQHGQRVDEAIPNWLKSKSLLLILDNCEHVVDTVAPITAAILRTAQNVRIVATSRQALDISGENVARVPSLDLPDANAQLSASKAMEFAAMALFVARVTSVDKSFTLIDDTAPIVADICRRLDGIPLAIELAAARVKVLSIPHLAQRLNERFKLLTGGSRDVLPRQKTLHALIDWSYDLLTAQEQLLFTRLGVFAGGFALEAVTSVCGGEGLDELDILDLLGSLTDKSLVVADTSGEHERYRLLESTAAYALEKLHASGEHDALARRHATHYRDQAEAARERYGSGSTQSRLASLESELDNFRTALTWALTDGNDAVLGGAIAGAFGLWVSAGLAVEGRYWIERALEVVSETEQPRIAARLQSALIGLVSGKRKFIAAERTMHLYALVGDAREVASAQRRIAFALFQMGDLDGAQAAIEQALAGLSTWGDALDVARALGTQAFIEEGRGDFRAARERYAQALAAYKALGNESGIASVLGNIAELEFADGHPEQALRWVSERLEIDLRGKNADAISLAYRNGCAYRVALDDLDGARESAREGLRFALQARNDLSIAVSLQHLALLAGLVGDSRRAAQLLGYVDARYAELVLKREFTEQWGYDKLLAVLHETLREDELAPLLAEGATWTEDRAVEEALQV